jgi:hypothetical protein
MTDADQPGSRARRYLTEPTIIASLIGGLCAVAAAVVPPLLTHRTETPTPIAVTSAAPATTPQPPALKSGKPNLTYGSWTLHGSQDDEGTQFDNSVVKFTSQQEVPDGLQLVGYFEWRDNGRYVGREHFTGNYLDDSRQLFLEGQYVEQPPEGTLAIGAFSAVLSADGRNLTSGTWGTSAGNRDGVPGQWQARR